MMELMQFIAKRISELRSSYNNGAGISQNALADNLGASTNTISRWETGTYKPGVEDIEKLSRFFGVSILTFFPDERSVENESVNALLRAAEDLAPTDLEELQRYAEFRKARSLHKKKGTKPGRKRKSGSEKK